jgi:hypothetical protein
MNVLCSAKPCPVLLSTTCVFYEGENLIYTGINTNDTVQLALQKIDEAFSNAILDISAILPISVTAGPSPIISISQASATSNGYISSTDWNIFNNKQNAVSLTTAGSSGPATFNGTTGALNIPDYSGSFSSFVPITRTLTINGVSQDLSADRTWTIDTLYTANGTLTGNRVVTLNANQLTFRSNQSTLQNYTFNIGTPTGLTPSTWPASVVFEGEYLMNSNNPEPYNTRVWGRNQSGSQRSLWVNQAYADITAESSGVTNLYNQYFASRRGSQLDTGTAGVIHNLTSLAGHGYLTTQNSTTSDITTSFVTTFQSFLQNYGGNITNAYNYLTRTNISNSLVANNTRNSTITNLYNLYIENNIGGNFATATVTNLYAVYIANNVGATGTITNRWGIYALDSAMKHYLNGVVLIGSASDSTFAKLQVTGAIQQSSVISSMLKTDSNGVLVAAAAGTDYQAPITLTVTGNSGSSTFIANTLNVPTYTLSGLGGVPTTRTLTINGTAYDLSVDRSWSVGTVTSIATSGPITGGTITGSGTIGITQSSSSTDGYLSSVDWNTFNNKQPQLNGTGFVKASGTTISYDNSTYYLASNPSAYIALTALSAGTGISYNNLTGVITNSAPDQVVTLTQGGTTVITGTYPNFTISSSDAFVGTVTSVSGTGTVSGLTLTGTVTSSGSLTLGGTLALTSLDITTGLGYTPYNATNPSGFVSSNIYTANGTLSADRTIDANGKILKFDDSNGIEIITTPHTNNAIYIEAAEPNINLKAMGATNGAAIFFSPSNASYYGALHNRTGGGLELYVGSAGAGSTPTVGLVLEATKQLKLNSYTSTSSFTGTAVGLLAFDSSGNILTVAAAGGGSGTVTSIATTGPITGGTITTSGTIGITQSTTSTDGYLSSTDWNTFNGKIDYNIYTQNGTLTGNRTVSTTSGYTLTLNPQTTALTTLTASTSDSSYAIVGQNTVSYASGFSSTNLGHVFGATGGISLQTFNGNATFANANLAAGHVSVNSIDFSLAGAGSIITMTQSTAPGVRAMAAHIAQLQYTRAQSGTISHLAIQQNLGIYMPAGAGTLTVTNAYSFLINPLDDYGVAGLTLTNRWGIYQASTVDDNYFGSKVLIGVASTLGIPNDAGAYNLQVGGQIRLNNYTTTTSYSGTVVGVLGFDASGNIITTTAGGGGGITRSVNNISTNITAGAAALTDYVYFISGTTTLTLPTAVGNTNRYTLKNVGINTITINTTSSQTIDGSASVSISVTETSIDVVSDGTNWNVI